MNTHPVELSNATEIARKCLAAASSAPSGDNMQPWRFELDEDTGRISVFIDELRDRSPMNAGQTMSRLACGAAVENIAIEAAAQGWSTEIDEGPGPSAASVRFVRAMDVPSWCVKLQAAIANRVTNRRIYTGQSICSGVLEELKRFTPDQNGIQTQWIDDRTKLNAAAELIGCADALMFGQPEMRAAFLSNVRFDRPAAEEVDEGLSLASLELSRTDCIALKTMRTMPDILFRLTGGLRLFAVHARMLVRSASGICIITAPDASTQSSFRAGRCMQRAWLALTAQGLAAQPMMSLLVLANLLEQGLPAGHEPMRRARIQNLMTDFRNSFCDAGQRRPMYLLRFGFAAPPSGRTGRLAPRLYGKTGFSA